MFTSERVIVSGSGPSLKSIDYQRIPRDINIVRVNNFFFEENYYLGRHVDVIQFSMDRRVTRFYLSTLRDVIRQDIYSVDRIITHTNMLPPHSFPSIFQNFNFRDQKLKRMLDRLYHKNRLYPTTGVLALLNAVEHGATKIYLAGFDFYEGSEKYAFQIPPRLGSVLKPNLSEIGYDRFHSINTDLQFLKYVLDKGVEVYLTSGSVGSPFAGVGLAPKLNDNAYTDMFVPKTDAQRVKDWNGRDGIYSVKFLRFGRFIFRLIKSLKYR